MRVVIAEDLALLREGLVALLRESQIDVVAQVEDGPALLRAIAGHKPDLAIVDVRLPPTYSDEGLLAAIEARRRQPALGVLVLSQYVETAYASELIGESETIGLTAGTTTTQIGRSLRHRRGISVITNALNIGMELCNQPAIKTMLTGGTLAWAWTFALAGQPALNFLQSVYLDKAFIGVTGFDLERGVTTLESEEAAVSLAMLRNAKRVIIVADSTKIGHVSPALICPISAIHVLVTDHDIPKHVHDELIARGVEVILA